VLARKGRHGQYDRVKIGTGELIFLGFVLLIVFSASRMSAIGNALGKFVYSFKKASKGEGFIDVKPTLSRSKEIEDAQVVDGKKS
jgi:sec-independent protein translocase protein TatA